MVKPVITSYSIHYTKLYDPAFEQAIKPLGAGEVSEPVETPEGIQLFKVLERQTGSIRQFDAVKGEISKILTEKKTDEAFKTWAEA